MADTGQKFIRRNRAPRVHITYEDPYDAERKVELPFVMGVMSDLSGNNPGVEKPDIAERKFLEFDMDNFDKPHGGDRAGRRLSRSTTSSATATGEKMSVDLAFQQDGRLQPGRGGAPGARAREAAGGARAALQPAALHGRQGGGRETRSRRC